MFRNHPIVRFLIRQATRDCRNEIYADTIAHGGRLEDPFFNFTIADGVAVFAFFESSFSIYVFRCDELELIYETNPLAMADVDECKRLIFEKYGKATRSFIRTLLGGAVDRLSFK